MGAFIKLLNFTLLSFFNCCYAYQFVYLLVSLLRKDPTDQKEIHEVPMHHFAVLIPARNEEAVISGLLGSLEQQTYPSELVDVYVIADNCTDRTAELSARLGAFVIERCFDHTRVGKGYALDYALKQIDAEKGISHYDAFLFFDADNVLDSGYLAAINRTYTQGYDIITSYRNSKNYDTNWISAGYALWFLRESRLLNEARMKLGTSCAISGTGFLISSKILLKDRGWKYTLLTEDIEFSTDHIIQGHKIGYCKAAILYDEQPITFRASWNQRLRWTKGFYQVFLKYGKKLCKGAAIEQNLQCYDMLMVIAPAMLVTLISLLTNLFFDIFGFLTRNLYISQTATIAFIGCLLNIYISLFLFGAITLLAEQKRIYCSKPKQVLYLFTFPIFIFTYIPMAVIALKKNITWKHIPHTILCNTDQICKKKNTKVTEQ